METYEDRFSAPSVMGKVDPDDAELAKLYRWTLHTKWGVSGAPGSGIGADDDFTCMCNSCRKSRRDRWDRDQSS